MNTKTIVLSFVALVATGLAQNPTAKPNPSQEIAPIVAVEEQERDLTKAERLYKEGIAGTALSAAAKELATVRLIDLLGKLGKVEEREQWMEGLAGGPLVACDSITEPSQQDRERQEALRKKAAELVQQVLAQSSVPYPSATGISDTQLRSHLLWLGPAVIPEIAAALAGEVGIFASAGQTGNQGPAFLNAITGLRRQAVAGLAGVIWELGGEAGESHLDALFTKPAVAFRLALAQFAWQAREPRMLRLVERWVRAEQDDQVAAALLSSAPANGSQSGLLRRLDMGTVLATLTERSPRLQARALELVTDGTNLSEANTATLQEFARRILAGTDPDLGRVALLFLASLVSQSTPLGIEMWLEQLPGLSEEWVGRSADTPSAWKDPGIQRSDGVIRRDVAEVLWPKLVRCARGVPSTSRRAEWLRAWMPRAAHALDEAIVPDVVDLVDRGWSRLLELLKGKVTAATAAQVFRLYDVESVGPQVLSILQGVDLPAELFAPLTERAAKLMATNPAAAVQAFVHLIASTGHPEAAAWITTQTKEGRIDKASLGWWLIHCGRRTQDEQLRVAMREVAQQSEVQVRSSLYLALLSMHDTATLARMSESQQGLSAVKHPYARGKDSALVSPFTYVLIGNPDPPHGFTEAEAVAFARTAGRWQQMPAWTMQDDFSGLSTPVVLAFAEVTGSSMDVSYDREGESGFFHITWQELAARRIASEADLQGPAHQWLAGLLVDNKLGHEIVAHLEPRDLIAVRPQLDRLLVGDHEEAALEAFETLVWREQPIDLEAMFASKHAKVVDAAVRTAIKRGSLSMDRALQLLPTSPRPEEMAQYFGDKVAAEAVPALLQLLQHSEESVRKAAADALAKIRFVHEQKSYWDRITKGLDASPTFAVEKLLLQAKPGAPTEQRLLAIMSLGTLGMPEALPFLIEWTQDADAGIAKAAKAAITQIHLQPRR